MFGKKSVTVVLAIFMLTLLCIFLSCGSLGGGVSRAVGDGVSSGIAGLITGGDSGSSSGSGRGYSSDEPSNRSGPERNYSGSTQTVPWPQDSSWARYGLSGLRQPAGTDVTGAALYMGQYMVSLINGGRPAFDNLAAQIDAIPGSELMTEIMDSESATVGYSVPGGTVHIMVDLENGDITIHAAQM